MSHVGPRPLSAGDGFGWNAAPEVTDYEVKSALTGRKVARDTFIDGQVRARLLRVESDDIVERMERCGIRGRSARGAVSVVGMVSGQAETATDYRNCNIIPEQQSRNVHDMHKHVRFLVDTTPKKNRLRMLVVSGGWCPYDQYRKHHKAHTRRMSRFAADKRLRDFGITVEYYNVENTIHRRDGKAMLNLHSHVLFRSTRFLGKKKWNAFLDFARNHFPKGYVHDSPVKSAAECVKYVFKPVEFAKMNDAEFTEFAHQVIGGRVKIDPATGEAETRYVDGEVVEVKEGPLKFYHPLGNLRKFRSELRRNRQKLIMVPTSDDRWIWRTTEKKQPAPVPETASAAVNDIVLAITRPMPKFTPRMEPCIIVQDYSGDFDRMVRMAGISAMVSEAKELFDARVRQDETALREAEIGSHDETFPMRHTTTTSVRGFQREGRGLDPPPRIDASPDAGGRLM